MDENKGKRISIVDFARERGKDRDTVATWIRRNPEVDGCCYTIGREKYIALDSEGYALLDKMYPYPKPVEVVEDTESKEKLMMAQNVIIQLQQQMADKESEKNRLQNELTLMQSQTKMLEDRANDNELRYKEEHAEKQKLQERLEEQQEQTRQAEKEKYEQQNRADQAELERKNAEERADRATDEAEKLKAELEEMKNMGFFARMFRWKK